jgi:hypothetical protein
MYRAKQKESEESVRKLEKKGERSWGHSGGRAWRQTQEDIYTSVSLHTQEYNPSLNSVLLLQGETPLVWPDATQLCSF